MPENLGFNKQEIEKIKSEMKDTGQSFVVIESEDNNNDFMNFYFLGMYEGREVIYDAALYTLKMQHNSEIFELAQHEVAKKFPNYKSIDYSEDENGDIAPLDDLDEEIGLYLTEVMDELEDDETVKVQEHVEIDPKIDFGVGLDAGLNVESISSDVIEKFIEEYNDASLKLDPTLYSFQFDDQD